METISFIYCIGKGAELNHIKVKSAYVRSTNPNYFAVHTFHKSSEDFSFVSSKFYDKFLLLASAFKSFQ